MTKGELIEIAKNGCPVCHGDIFTQYKANRTRMFKCLRCHRVFFPFVIDKK